MMFAWVAACDLTVGDIAAGSAFAPAPPSCTGQRGAKCSFNAAVILPTDPATAAAIPLVLVLVLVRVLLLLLLTPPRLFGVRCVLLTSLKIRTGVAPLVLLLLPPTCHALGAAAAAAEKEPPPSPTPLNRPAPRTRIGLECP
jgi:hypothetical protein